MKKKTLIQIDIAMYENFIFKSHSKHYEEIKNICHYVELKKDI